MAKRDGGGQGPDFSTWVRAERTPAAWHTILAFVDEGARGRLARVQHETTGRACAFEAVRHKYKPARDLAAVRGQGV